MSGTPTTSIDPGLPAARRDRRGAASGLALPGLRLRRVCFFALVLATTVFGVERMLDILRANGLTIIEAAIAALFAVTFAWIVIAFWTGVSGFVLRLFDLDPLALRRPSRAGIPGAPVVSRTAVVMPVYNEDVRRVFAGLESTHASLLATGLARHFDFYLLSDTTDTAVAAAEEAAWLELQEGGGAGRWLFYRRRSSNAGRKAGNVADFCRRWGAGYDYMIVLDADSIMSGDALLSLVRLMQANPRAGMIQTVPLPVAQHTMFGRFLQFAAWTYGPMLATGLSFWQADAANYWGHNAILRVPAFIEHCGLPTLSGAPPLGGEILSHDFVESALMRRRGWHVYLLPGIGGSYEEVPGTILEYARRDRRWAQGNLQHLRLIAAQGLHPLSRFNFLMGATAYLSSLFWLVMLGLSTVDAIERAVAGHAYFGAGYQLFPDWPVVKTHEIVSLLWITLALLLLPKLLGLVLCLLRRDRRRAFGGSGSLLASAAIEAVFAALIAPLMMIFHTRFVLSVLCGGQSGWKPQDRGGSAVPWAEAAKFSAVASCGGLIWAMVTRAFAPQFFWWLAPVLLGLAFCAPLVWWSSHPRVGRSLRRRRILLAPPETDPPALLRAGGGTGGPAAGPRAPGRAPPPPAVPPARLTEMPVQTLGHRPLRLPAAAAARGASLHAALRSALRARAWRTDVARR